MENASKALIIAGAILLSILIIALGVFVFNQARSAMGNVGLSDQEVSAFNSKWESYQGTQMGSSIRQMVNNLNAYNRNVTDGRYIQITASTTASASGNVVASPASGTQISGTQYNSSFYPAGNKYDITFDYSDGGLITMIYIKGTNATTATSVTVTTCK